MKLYTRILKSAVLFSAMVMICALSLAGTTIHSYAQTVQSVTSSDKATSLYLYKYQEDDSTPFKVTNMFPGDKETINYYVKVAHQKSVTVKFHADIRAGYEKLAEVLKVKIIYQNDILYDGLMRDMPASIDFRLSGSGNNELKYEIAVYLDTSVGNEYQKLMLIADFRWWVEGELNQSNPTPTPTPTSDPGNTDSTSTPNPINTPGEGSGTTGLSNPPILWLLEEFIIDDMVVPLAGLPKTGDHSNFLLWAVLAGGMAVVLVVVIVMRRKGAKDETE